MLAREDSCFSSFPVVFHADHARILNQHIRCTLNGRNGAKRGAFRLRTERLHEVVEVLAAEELVTFPKELARHGDRPDETRGERREEEKEMKRSAATGTLVDTAGEITEPPLGRSARLRELKRNVKMRRVRARKPSLPRSCSSLSLSLASLPPSHSIFSFPSSSHPHDWSFACSAIDTGGRALPLDCTSSFPLLGATLFPPRQTAPSRSALRSSFSRPFRTFRPSTGKYTKLPRLAPTRSLSHPRNLFAAADPTPRPACATFVLLGVPCETLILHLASCTRTRDNA